MHQFYVLNAPDNVPLSRPYTLQILPEYTSFIVEIRPKFARFAPQMRRKRIANRPFSARILPNFCQQFTRFLPVFRPAICPQKCPQTCLFNATNTPVMRLRRKYTRLAPQTCPKNIAKRPFCAAKAPTNTPV